MARTQIEHEGFNANPADECGEFASRPSNNICICNTRCPMALLYYLSYVAAAAAFVFVTLSLASGLLYISELIEEHSRLAKIVGQRATYAIIALHALLHFTDSLPLLQTTFSIVCHIVYLQNFSTQWPLITLSSASFIASCTMAIVNHFLWFMHFSRLARDARQSYRHRGPVFDTPGFTDISTFFGICVWLIPLFLFLSLSANDNALPTALGAVDPSSTASPSGVHRANSSLFKSMFSVFSKDKITLSYNSKLISPPSAPPPAYPPMSPSTSPFLPAPPRSPTASTHKSQREYDSMSFPQSRFSRRPSQVLTGLDNSRSSRRTIHHGRDHPVDE